jgi:hypothetical protein
MKSGIQSNFPPMLQLSLKRTGPGGLGKGITGPPFPRKGMVLKKISSRVADSRTAFRFLIKQGAFPNSLAPSLDNLEKIR